MKTMADDLRPYRDYRGTHFRFDASPDGKVATITLDRPAKKNPLTFDTYAELRELFRGLVHANDVKAVVVTGAGGNFSSGGDVQEIIGPLTKMAMPEILAFTRMTGDLVLAMRRCPQPIVAAVDGVCGWRIAEIRNGANGCARGGRSFRLPRREDSIPLHARGAGGLRHGRMYAASAYDWTGPRGGIAL